jgi:hypothetical protein
MTGHGNTMSFKSNWKLGRCVLPAILGIAVVIGCAASGARAADNDDEDVPLDTKIVRGILKGLGLRREEPVIDYRERSPLVLPPGNNLPPPESAAAAVKKTTNWPDDPDVKQARKKKQAERDRKPYTEGVDDRPLLPNQYSSNAPARAGTGTTGKTAEEAAAPSSNSELGAKSIFSWWKPSQDAVTFTGEPPRESLIDPPPGYRTPSPTQAFGVGQKEWKPSAINPSGIHDDVK